MSALSYSLAFDGYWRAPNVRGLPAGSGIYCVYACRYNALENTVALRRLLYIGEAENVRDRLCGHECWDEWRGGLQPSEELCVSVALISPAGARRRAEAAMINHHKPPCNTEYAYAFPFDETTVLNTGNAALLTVCITVYQSPLLSLASLLGTTVRR